MTDPVVTELSDGIMTITLNRPEAKNAVNLAVARGIADALERLDSDDAIRVGILTGANNTFCSGMDLKAFFNRRSTLGGGTGIWRYGRSAPRNPINCRG